eukprot:ANDGO_07954.mRNA.1 hypothetical protein
MVLYKFRLENSEARPALIRVSDLSSGLVSTFDELRSRLNIDPAYAFSVWEEIDNKATRKLDVNAPISDLNLKAVAVLTVRIESSTANATDAPATQLTTDGASKPSTLTAEADSAKPSSSSSSSSSSNSNAPGTSASAPTAGTVGSPLKNDAKPASSARSRSESSPAIPASGGRVSPASGSSSHANSGSSVSGGHGTNSSNSSTRAANTPSPSAQQPLPSTTSSAGSSHNQSHRQLTQTPEPHSSVSSGTESPTVQAQSHPGGPTLTRMPLVPTLVQSDSRASMGSSGGSFSDASSARNPSPAVGPDDLHYDSSTNPRNSFISQTSAGDDFTNETNDLDDEFSDTSSLNAPTPRSSLVSSASPASNASGSSIPTRSSRSGTRGRTGTISGKGAFDSRKTVASSRGTVVSVMSGALERKISAEADSCTFSRGELEDAIEDYLRSLSVGTVRVLVAVKCSMLIDNSGQYCSMDKKKKKEKEKEKAQSPAETKAASEKALAAYLKEEAESMSTKREDRVLAFVRDFCGAYAIIVFSSAATSTPPSFDVVFALPLLSSFYVGIATGGKESKDKDRASFVVDDETLNLELQNRSRLYVEKALKISYNSMYPSDAVPENVFRMRLASADLAAAIGSYHGITGIPPQALQGGLTKKDVLSRVFEWAKSRNPSPTKPQSASRGPQVGTMPDRIFRRVCSSLPVARDFSLVRITKILKETDSKPVIDRCLQLLEISVRSPCPSYPEVYNGLIEALSKFDTPAYPIVKTLMEDFAFLDTVLIEYRSRTDLPTRDFPMSEFPSVNSASSKRKSLSASDPKGKDKLKLRAALTGKICVMPILHGVVPSSFQDLESGDALDDDSQDFEWIFTDGSGGLPFEVLNQKRQDVEKALEEIVNYGSYWEVFCQLPGAASNVTLAIRAAWDNIKKSIGVRPAKDSTVVFDRLFHLSSMNCFLVLIVVRLTFPRAYLPVLRNPNSVDAVPNIPLYISSGKWVPLTEGEHKVYEKVLDLSENDVLESIPLSQRFVSSAIGFFSSLNDLLPPGLYLCAIVTKMSDLGEQLILVREDNRTIPPVLNVSDPIAVPVSADEFVESNIGLLKQLQEQIGVRSLGKISDAFFVDELNTIAMYVGVQMVKEAFSAPPGFVFVPLAHVESLSLCAFYRRTYDAWLSAYANAKRALFDAGPTPDAVDLIMQQKVTDGSSLGKLVDLEKKLYILRWMHHMIFRHFRANAVSHQKELLEAREAMLEDIKSDKLSWDAISKKIDSWEKKHDSMTKTMTGKQPFSGTDIEREIAIRQEQQEQFARDELDAEERERQQVDSVPIVQSSSISLNDFGRRDKAYIPTLADDCETTVLEIVEAALVIVIDEKELISIENLIDDMVFEVEKSSAMSASESILSALNRTSRPVSQTAEEKQRLISELSRCPHASFASNPRIVSESRLLCSYRPHISKSIDEFGGLLEYAEKLSSWIDRTSSLTGVIHDVQELERMMARYKKRSTTAVIQSSRDPNPINAQAAAKSLTKMVARAVSARRFRESSDRMKDVEAVRRYQSAIRPSHSSASALQLQTQTQTQTQASTAGLNPRSPGPRMNPSVRRAIATLQARQALYNNTSSSSSSRASSGTVSRASPVQSPRSSRQAIDGASDHTLYDTASSARSPNVSVASPRDRNSPATSSSAQSPQMSLPSSFLELVSDEVPAGAPLKQRFFVPISSAVERSDTLRRIPQRAVRTAFSKPISISAPLDAVSVIAQYLTHGHVVFSDTEWAAALTPRSLYSLVECASELGLPHLYLACLGHMFGDQDSQLLEALASSFLVTHSIADLAQWDIDMAHSPYNRYVDALWFVRFLEEFSPLFAAEDLESLPIRDFQDGAGMWKRIYAETRISVLARAGGKSVISDPDELSLWMLFSDVVSCLFLARSVYVDDEVVGSVVDCCPHLDKIDVRQTALTTRGLDSLLQRVPRVVI